MMHSPKPWVMLYHSVSFWKSVHLYRWFYGECSLWMLWDDAQKIDGVISEGYRNVIHQFFNYLKMQKIHRSNCSIHSPNSRLFGVPSTQKSFYPLVQLETPHPDKMRRSLIFVDIILNIWFFLSTEVQTEYVAEFSSITCMRLFLASDLSGKSTSGPFRCCMASVAVPPKLKFWQIQRRLP